jgi:integrase
MTKTPKITDVEKMPLFTEFCNNRSLAPSSIILYRISLNKYISFTGKTLEELLDEAENEEDTGIRMRKRKLQSYLNGFKQSLEDKDLAKNTITNTMTQVKSFYNAHGIMLPVQPRRKSRKDRIIESYDDLPTMEEIITFIDYCSPVYKAMVTTMLSSGMSRAEICSLTFQHFYESIELNKNPKTLQELIDKLEELTPIPTWRVIRIKTGKPYFTFSSPESSDYILKYFKYYHNKYPDFNPEPTDYLFRNNNKIVNPAAMSEMFRVLNDKAGFRKVGDKYLLRPHVLRKVFATTLEKNKFPYLGTRWLLGHDIDKTTSAYFKADPVSLKQDYIEVLDQLTTNKVEIKVINQYSELSEKLEQKDDEIIKLKAEKDEEMAEMRRELNLVKDLLIDKGVRKELDKR